MLRMLTHVTNSDNDIEDEESSRGGSQRGSVMAAAAVSSAASEGRGRGGAGVVNCFPATTDEEQDELNLLMCEEEVAPAQLMPKSQIKRRSVEML